VKLATARLVLEKVTKNNLLKGGKKYQILIDKSKEFTNIYCLLKLKTATTCGTCSDGYKLDTQNEC